MVLRINTNRITDAAITTAKMAANSVTNNILADEAFTSGKIADSAVTTAKLNNGAVTNEKIASGTISADKFQAGIVLPSPSSNTTWILTNDGTSAIWRAQTALRIDISQVTGIFIDSYSRNWANGAFVTANAAFTSANGTIAWNTANAAFTSANGTIAWNTANAAFTSANASFTSANGTIAWNTANAAYNRANNSINANTGGTVTGNLTVVGTILSNTVSSNTVTFKTEYDNGSSGASKTIDFGVNQKQKLLLTSNTTLTFTAPPGVGNFLLKLVQDGTGSRYVTWPASVKWASNTRPTLTTTINAIDIASFYYDGTNYFGVVSTNFA